MKDIILIVGQTSVGKTTASSYLRQIAKRRRIPYEPRLVSDFCFLLDQTLIDDKLGGFRHYHNWSKGRSNGHQHGNEEAILPFVVTHSDLADGMHNEFFKAITQLPSSGKFWFVEWTGGINTNSSEEPASHADFSFNRTKKRIKENSLSAQWFERIYAVIHISADLPTRFHLNTKDSAHQSLEILSGQVSAKRIMTVLKIFGQDDFLSIKPLFEDIGVNLFELYNKGDDQFYKELELISKRIFGLPDMSDNQSDNEFAETAWLKEENYLIPRRG